MNFDSLARSYQAFEYTAFAPVMHRMRIHFLDECAGVKKILLAGEGDGRFLAELRRQWPEAEVDCIDVSGRMLAQARKRLDRRGPDQQLGVHFIQADLRTHVLAENKYDLVVTHFFLDCFNEATLRGLVSKLAASARPGALWLLSDFSLPPGGWRRLRAWIWLKVLYTFFRIVARIEAETLVDPRALIEENGWQCRRTQTAQHGLLYSSIWQKTVA
jgi:ubiquinone/menaquinone biosynthesis C-methylase UbiE